jgi:hypothetical protein
MAARKPARGRGAKTPRPRFRTSAANAKARALHKASPPRRTHHPQIRCSVCSRLYDEPSPSFCLSKLSDDHADPAGDYKFNPLVLAEIQTGADSG